MPRRENITRRRQPVGVTPRTILAYCGAVRTEPDYLDSLRVKVRSGTVTVKLRKGGTDPVKAVRAAADYRVRRPGDFDEVWCVVDVDEFDIRAAFVAARRSGVQLAVSNPCFELWLLLHHADCRAFCRDCREVKRRLAKHLPTYDKTQLNFADFAAGIADAVRRAKDLDPTGEDWRRNPSTNIWQLVERIMGEE